jgi:hypothetical protein
MLAPNDSRDEVSIVTMGVQLKNEDQFSHCNSITNAYFVMSHEIARYGSDNKSYWRQLLHRAMPVIAQ